MQTPIGLAVALVLCGALLSGPALLAAGPGTASPAKSTPGLEAAQAISTITGVAISPLLGVSGIGVVKYFKTPPEKRASLPWYAQPWFWVPALFLLTVVFLKDTFGAALPTAVKKPLDVLEAIENKISALVAAGAFIPLIAAIFSATGEDTALYGNAGLAIVNIVPLLNVLTVPLAIAAFVVVWMVAHVINVLILISPFTFVDAALKSARLFVLGTVAGTSLANPYLGAVWSLLIILVCCFLAGWAFRLMVFGSVFVWDLATLRKTRFKVDPAENWLFTARATDKTPVRSYGKLIRDPQGGLIFSYRPWLFLPRRIVTLPLGRCAVGRGLFYSEVIRMEGDAVTPIFTLPPRYRSHEEEVSAIYALTGVQEAGIVKGFKAVWRWLKGSVESHAVPPISAAY